MALCNGDSKVSLCLGSLPPSGSVSETWGVVRVSLPACRSLDCAASRYRRRLVDFASVEIPAAEEAPAAVGFEFQLSGDLALGSGSRGRRGPSAAGQDRGLACGCRAGLACGLLTRLGEGLCVSRCRGALASPADRSLCSWSQVCSAAVRFSRHPGGRGRVAVPAHSASCFTC